MKRNRWIIGVATVAWVAMGTGCVSLDEHRQLQMAHRSLQGEKEQLEQELYDARMNNDNLRTKLTATEGRLNDREALVTNLQAENERLHKAFSDAQGIATELASKDLLNKPIVIETMLPAELDSALRDFANQHPSSVEYDAKRGIVKWKSDLLFALGSDVVKESAMESLAGFSEIITSPAASGFDALVVGFTDDRPIVRPETKQHHPTNWHLSAHRAIAVCNVLQHDGIAPTRVGIMGFGEYRPIEPNTTEEGRAQNRRVEIFVVPTGSIGGVIAPSVAAADGARTKLVSMDDNIK